MNFWERFKFKISLYRPVSKKELIDSRYDVAVLVKAVKEIEAMNRTDISYILKKFKSLEGTSLKKEETTENTISYQ